MNRSTLSTMLAGGALLLSLVSPALQAQNRPDRGNFDPEQMRQRQMQRYREQFGVTDDAEWKVIEARVEKVQQARREVGFGGMGFGGMGRRGPAVAGDQPGAQPGATASAGPAGDNANARRNRPGFGAPEPNPEVEALQKAVEAKASPEELKKLMAKIRDSRREKEAALEKAQDELKKVLSVRQEASAVLMGLIR